MEVSKIYTKNVNFSFLTIWFYCAKISWRWWWWWWWWRCWCRRGWRGWWWQRRI